MRIYLVALLVVFCFPVVAADTHDSESTISVSDLLFVAANVDREDFDPLADVTQSGLVNLFDLVFVAARIGLPRSSVPIWASSINGVCGDRASTFSHTTTSWPAGSVYCAQGDASVEPDFPEHEVVWECIGELGGQNASCMASRNAPFEPSAGFAHVPQGWTTRINSSFDYPSIAYTNPPWLGITDSVWSGATRDIAYITLEQELQGPVSGPHTVRFFYPEGFEGGYATSNIFSHIITNTGGIYYAYAMRLSDNWSQLETPITGNTFKHVEVGASTPEVGSVLLARTAVTKIPGDSQDRFRVKLANWANNDEPEHVISEATAWGAGEWVIVELLIEFNDGGPSTGSMRLWANQHLAAILDDTDLPFTGISTFNVPNVFGGGIGDVPHDQYYDLDHVLVLTKP